VTRTLIVIVPSTRVPASEFVTILSANGIDTISLGTGTAKVRTAQGRENRVAGALVAAILSADLRRARAHAKLCGVHLSTLEINGCPSRANVV